MDNAEREYIDAEEAIKIIEEAAEQYPYKVLGNRDTYSQYNEAWQDACDYILSRIEAQKAADIKPVKRGQWIVSTIPQEQYVCSQCGGACWYYDYMRELGKSKYCPSCGAYMR